VRGVDGGSLAGWVTGMRDVVVLLMTGGFFGVCLGYVRWCDHIIGPDPADLDDAVETAQESRQ